MYILRSFSNDPYYNLALEEYVFKKMSIDEDILFLWRNQQCVVIGRNQNPYLEVNIAYAYQNNIPIIRRNTGGGTVYHDLGNINYTFITKNPKTKLSNYPYFLQPIISILQNIGIPARFQEKSHIYVGDAKISGNAQTWYKNRMIHHGTLLYDIDVSQAKEVLHVNKTIKTHQIPSEKATITNIKQLLPYETTVTEFVTFLEDQLSLNDPYIKQIQLSEDDEKRIQMLQQDKYQSFDWTYSLNKPFTIEENEYSFTIHKGLITETSHYTDLLLDQQCSYVNINRLLKHKSDKEEIIQLLFQ